MKIFIVCFTALLIISGCDFPTTKVRTEKTVQTESEKPIDVGSNQELSIKPVPLNLDSPDNAVKTWWKAQDNLLESNYLYCLNTPLVGQEEYAKSIHDSFKSIATVALEATLRPTSFECNRTKYRYEITEVKTESETRAIVFARIMNVTPVKEGYVLTESDKENRAYGFKYRYVVEKENGLWKVDQVYEYNVYANGEQDRWNPIYVVEEKFYSPGHVSNP